MKLASSNITIKSINEFEKNTAEFVRTWDWKVVLGAVIGAAIGFIVGAMLGIWAGPTAAVTALLGGVSGAIFGASLAGFGGAALVASLGMWHNRKNDPLRQVINAAETVAQHKSIYFV